MQLKSFRPKSKLVTKSTQIIKPRFPVIDTHNHLGQEFGGDWIHRPIPDLINVLDQAGVEFFVDLDGGWGENILEEHIKVLSNTSPDRFLVFGGINWDMWKLYGDEFPEWAASRLRNQVKIGAKGLKVWKSFGLSTHDQHGKLVQVDDNRLNPIWDTAAELRIPVTIHVADPVAFFDPLDETNERWEELSANPEWQFPSPPFSHFYVNPRWICQSCKKSSGYNFYRGTCGMLCRKFGMGRIFAGSLCEFLY